MEHWKRIALAVSVLAVTTACSQPDNREADAKSLKDHEAAWIKDVAAKDLNKWANYYTDDATLIVSGAPAMVGKAKITEGLKMLVDDPNFKMEFSPKLVEVAKSGEIGYTEGTYTMTMTDPVSKNKVEDKGNYVTTYRKQADGSWKSYVDASITEVPPPPPRASAEKKKN